MKSPNVVVFMADQLVAPPPEGRHPCATPHIDRLATEGVSFDQAIVPTPACSPSRATFHTGLLPSFHRTYINVHHTYACQDMDPSLPTLASVLRSQGYRTGQAGVWHVTSDRSPAEYGFESTFGEERMFDPGGADPIRTIELPGDTFSDKRLLAAVYAEGTYGIEREVEAAIRFIEECANDAERPMFLYFSTRIPHSPWKVTDSDLGRVPEEAVTLPASFREDTTGEHRIDPFEYNGCDYAYWLGAGERLREALRYYYALVAKVDEQIGVLIETLKRMGMWDDTVFVFTSDHGEMAGAHNLIGKGFDFYDEVSRVPLIVRRPGHGRPGRRVGQAVGFEDIMPTVCELAGTDVPDGCRGRSLLPLFEGGDPDRPDEIFVEQYNHVFPGYAVGLRSRNRLYVFDPTRGEQLYDRKNDPGETANLALEPEHTDDLKELRPRLVSVMRNMKHPMAERIATAVGHLESISSPSRP